MAIRIPWDQYESAFLLYYCLEIEQKNISCKEAITLISQKLRARAVAKGYEIDNIFRNENGISMQLSAMRNCYLGKVQGLKFSKLFQDVVKLYHENRVAFQQILQEDSPNMTESKWQKFLHWLKCNYPEKERETISALTMVNMFGRRNKIIKSSIGNIVSKEEIVRLQNVVFNPKLMNLHSKKHIKAAYNALSVYIEFLELEGRNNDKPQTPDLSDTDEVEQQDNVVDFSSSKSYAHTKPTSCFYKGQAVPCNSWNALFINVLKRIYQDNKDIFPVGKSLSSGSRMDTGAADAMINPKEIADGVYLECNVSVTGIVNKLRLFMDYCGIGYECIVIKYRRNNKADSSSGSEAVSLWQPAYTDQIEELLSDKYKYGFRIGSSIEIMRLRNYASADNIFLPESDEELEREIRLAGTMIDGKVYVIGKEVLTYLDNQFEDVFQSGVGVVFLDIFYEKNLEFMEANHIASIEMLKEILRRSCPECYLGQNIITPNKKKTEIEATMEEINRISEEASILVYDKLVERLEFIPAKKILRTLSDSDEVVYIGEGKYFRLNHFVVSEGEAVEICQYVSGECDRNGYASITGVPMGNIPEENYELTSAALHTAIYTALLKQEYCINGKILTRENSEIDIRMLLRAFCRNYSECTVVEVMDRMLELTNARNKQYAMTALLDTMVRVDKERFVTESQIHFDVEAIDDLLKDQIGDGFIPVKSISTFVLFPLCGVRWNHYLLESFCYRFSKRYRLSVMNYNDKNAGLIVFSNLSMTYNEMLCEAAAKADIDLTQKAVGSYFFENGYTAKRKYASLPEILEKAAAIREER